MAGDGRRMTWWIGVLFAVGASCFAVGAVPGYLPLVGPEPDGATFFIGSIFFTSAAFLQYLQSANEGRSSDALNEVRFRVFTFEPHRPDWWATTVQLVGTVCFNLSTFHALSRSLSSPSYNRRVWTPDIVGCICFLVASEVAFAEVGHALWSWTPRQPVWRIAALNLAGSVAFAVSGVASYVIPSTDTVRNMSLVNVGT